MNTFIVPFLTITGAGAAFGGIVDMAYFTLLITHNNKVLMEMLPLATENSKLPNPYPLTFTGAVSETYDGSSAKTIEIPSGGSGAHSDWNQNDSTAADYIKNRPFYTGDPVETVLVEESTVSFTDSNHGFYVAEFESTFEAIVGETYKVSWDGTVYECTCVDFSGKLLIGNLSIVGVGSDTGEPFAMGVANGARSQIVTLDTSDTHTFSISGFVAEVIKIADKYISDTFRDVIIVRDPLHWSTDDWTKYYNLFKGGKLLKINSSRGSNFEGYVLSMFYHETAGRQMSVIANEAFYTLSVDNTTGEFYWSPIFELDSLYFKYQETGYDTEYCRLERGGNGLKFTTKTKDKGLVFRDIVLEGDKALVVASSTPGSTKKFKITVDDNGAITATEIGAES